MHPIFSTPARRRSIVALLVADALVLVLGGFESAHADPYPVDGGPDTGDHSYCFDPGRPMATPVRDRAHWTMNNDEGVEAQTVVNTVYKSDCGPHTDVLFGQDDLGGAAMGYAPCATWAADGVRCDRRRVLIDWTYIEAAASNDLFQARKTLCHEVGHTLGANHYSSIHQNPDGPVVASHSCMLTGLADNGALWTRSYGPHHRAHIDAWF